MAEPAYDFTEVSQSTLERPTLRLINLPRVVRRVSINVDGELPRSPRVRRILPYLVTELHGTWNVYEDGCLTERDKNALDGSQLSLDLNSDIAKERGFVRNYLFNVRRLEATRRLAYTPNGLWLMVFEGDDYTRRKLSRSKGGAWILSKYEK